MVHIRLPQTTLTSKHFSQHDSDACIPRYKESVSSVCSLAVTACFELVSAAHHMPAMCFASEVQVDGNLWAPFCHQTCYWLWCYDWEVMNHPTTLLTVLISHSVISISLNPIKSCWLASNLQKIPIRRSCHIWAANSWHSFLLCWDTRLGARMGQKFYPLMLNYL
jgi:hypothetical protein